MATLKAAYNRFLSAFSRFWAQQPREDETEETSSDRVQEIPTIKVVEVDDRTLLPSSATESVTLRVGNGRRKETKALFRRSYYALRSSTESLLKKSPKKMTDIRLSDSKTISTENFLSRLNDYNTYHDGAAERLAKRQNKKGELVVEGLLNIYWGLKTAIRLQLADDDEKIRPQIQEGSEGPENGQEGNQLQAPGGSASGLDIENAIWGKTRQRRNDKRRGAMRLRVPDHSSKADTDSDDESGGNLARTSSVIMRKKKSRYLKHRASINGHTYNYRTSVFTPAFGSVTKVRVTSQNNAHTVVTKLFAKFRVENSSDDFSLYIVKETGERRELPGDEFPLISRVLVGPNEKLGKIYLQERKMHKEITPEVAQYIKLDLRILQVFLTKFAEEEDKEVSKMKKRFEFYRKMLRKEIREQKQAQQAS